MPLVIQIFDYNWQLMIRTTILDMSRSWTQDTGITWSMNRPPKLADSQFRDLKLILSSTGSPRPRFYHVYESPCNRINSFPIRQVRRQISNSFLLSAKKLWVSPTIHIKSPKMLKRCSRRREWKTLATVSAVILPRLYLHFHSSHFSC